MLGDGAEGRRGRGDEEDKVGAGDVPVLAGSGDQVGAGVVPVLLRTDDEVGARVVPVLDEEVRGCVLDEGCFVVDWSEGDKEPHERREERVEDHCECRA